MKLLLSVSSIREVFVLTFTAHGHLLCSVHLGDLATAI